MSDVPVVLVNHLLEPPGKVTGITRYLFSLLEELSAENAFQYALATNWKREMLPEPMRCGHIDVYSHEFVESTPLNVANQMVIMPGLMRRTGAVIEFNCNPIGCFWPFWRRVITVHDLYFDLMPEAFPWRHRIWWRTIFPRMLSGSSAIICVSEATREHLHRRYPKTMGKSCVIHEAGILKGELCRAARHSPLEVDFEEPYVLLVGNLSPNKNVSVLVEALSLLERDGRATTVYHVGRDDLGLLESALRRTRLERPICTYAGISDAELARFYKHARFLVSTSTDEGFCLPILEAQSFGTPVVCSDIPVFREVAGRGAIFFNPADPAALADAFVQMSSDSELRARVAFEARSNASMFSWSLAARMTSDLFRSILDSGRLPRGGASQP